MIEIIAERINGDYRAPDIRRVVSLPKAMISLVRYELGYGGEIVEFTDNTIICETHVLACKDTTRFFGSKEEILLLLQASRVYYILRQKYKEEDIQRIVDRTKGNAFLITAFRGINEVSAGRNYSQFACSAVMAQSEKDFRTLISIKDSEDFEAMLDLYHEQGPKALELVEVVNG